VQHPLLSYLDKIVTFDEVYMPKRVVHRTQTGVRIESSLLKVLKGLAEYTDMSLGDLLEGIVLHSFEGKAPFSSETQAVIDKLKSVYDCTLTAADSHKLEERA
jgi:predicted DNA-binding ribbon-helix-helix protein